jgi:hypothetical protein
MPETTGWKPVPPGECGEALEFDLRLTIICFRLAGKQLVLPPTFTAKNQTPTFMKKTLFPALIVFLLIVCRGPLGSAQAQGTAFSYQGQLYAGTNLAHGKYDFQFALSNAPSGGLQLGPTVTNLGVGVTNGLFITTLDFGNVFSGQSNWLAIAVRTNGASGFTPLSPLQAITPTPYAIFAESANAANLVGTISPYNLPDGLGGGGNTAVGVNATVAGGGSNVANHEGAMIPGGEGNTASGYDSFAAGTLAKATNDGAFVWADSQLQNFNSTNNDSFNVRARGGARFVTSGAGLSVDGPLTAASFSGDGS